MTAKQLRCEESKKWLRENMKLWPGQMIYTSMRHCSRSGMYRKIAVFTAIEGVVFNISGHVADAIDAKDCDGSVGVGGCGMDMGFHIVYSLGRALFQEEAEKSKGKAANALRRALLKAQPSYYAQGFIGGVKYTQLGRVWDCGYALKHKWI